MLTVHKLEKLDFTDSTAWLGEISEGNKIYIVFRYGLLQVFAGENGRNPIHHGKMIYNETISYFHESEMDTARMKELVAKDCKFEDD